MTGQNTFEVEAGDVEYQRLAGKPWLVRVYRPNGAGPFPTIVDVHGGAWHNGDRTNNAAIDRELAARGIVVAAVDFRQPPEAGYPASICDLNLAIRWLKVHAAEFNGTDVVGAFGNSSGGHQVVLSALRPRHANYAALPLPNHPEIDARLAYVIAAWPVIDPLFRFRYAQELNRRETVQAHWDYWKTEEAMAEGNPQTIVESDEPVELPPLLMLLKANDRNHPLEMQERFIASYRSAAERSRYTPSKACRSTAWCRRPANPKRCAPWLRSPISFAGRPVPDRTRPAADKSDLAVVARSESVEHLTLIRGHLYLVAAPRLVTGY